MGLRCYLCPKWKSAILSFNEKIAIEIYHKSIDSYTYFQTQHIFTKCLGIGGFSGRGKTWTLEYMVLYGISEGVFYLTISMMEKRAIQLGGKVKVRPFLAWTNGITYF